MDLKIKKNQLIPGQAYVFYRKKFMFDVIIGTGNKDLGETTYNKILGLNTTILNHVINIRHLKQKNYEQLYNSCSSDKLRNFLNIFAEDGGLIIKRVLQK